MTDATRLAEAVDFAARAHVAQRRKGAAAEPYINHLTDVTARLAASQHGDDVELLIAGMLHDTVEDVGVTTQQLTERFGATVAALVEEVTDDKSLPKAERKRLQVEHAPHKSLGARLIKLADKTSNVTALVESPPPDWSHKRLVAYIDWAEAVIAGCRGIDVVLERAFDEAVAAARKKIGESHRKKEPTS